MEESINGLRNAGELDEDTSPIEGLIWRKKDGTWVMEVVGESGRRLVVQVDYCPWCGRKLSKVGFHTHD